MKKRIFILFLIIAVTLSFLHFLLSSCSPVASTQDTMAKETMQEKETVEEEMMEEETAPKK